MTRELRKAAAAGGGTQSTTRCAAGPHLAGQRERHGDGVGALRHDQAGALGALVVVGARRAAGGGDNTPIAGGDAPQAARDGPRAPGQSDGGHNGAHIELLVAGTGGERLHLRVAARNPMSWWLTHSKELRGAERPV